MGLCICKLTLIYITKHNYIFNKLVFSQYSCILWADIIKQRKWVALKLSNTQIELSQSWARPKLSYTDVDLHQSWVASKRSDDDLGNDFCYLLKVFIQTYHNSLKPYDVDHSDDVDSLNDTYDGLDNASFDIPVLNSKIIAVITIGSVKHEQVGEDPFIYLD